MKTKLKEISEFFLVEMRATYPDFPFTIEPSPDDEDVLCIRVYAVPSEKVAEVKAFIRGRRENEVIGGDVLILPMIKDLDVTRVHYPEYLPKQTATNYSVYAWMNTAFKPAVSKWDIQKNKNLEPSPLVQQNSFSWINLEHIGSLENIKESVRNKPVSISCSSEELQLAA